MGESSVGWAGLSFVQGHTSGRRHGLSFVNVSSAPLVRRRAGEIGATLRDSGNTELRCRIEADAPVITSAKVDLFGGLTIFFSNGLQLEIFPDASGASHDRWEFWRLLVRDGPHLVVGSDGAHIRA